MKRKFKLFATVASLCLCLALMAFGVYAASSVTYTTKGSVSFVLNDVFVTVNSKLDSTVGGNAQTAKEGTQKVSYTGDTVKEPSEDFAYTQNFEDVAFTKTGDLVKVTVTIKNDGETAIKVKFTVSVPSDSEHLSSSIKYADDDKASEAAYTSGTAKDLASGKTAALTVEIKLRNMEKTLTSADCGYNIVAKAAIDDTNLA